MKLKRFITLFIILVLFSGCEANYYLTIDDDDNIKEKITLLEKNSIIGSTENEVKEQLEWVLIFSDDETEPAYFYNKQMILGTNKSGVEFDYNFDANNFYLESDIMRNCFSKYDFVLTEELLKISASGFRCLENIGDGNIVVNIAANGELISGNFEQNRDNHYIWNLSSSKANELDLTIDRSKVGQKADDWTLVIIILLVVGIIGGIIFFVAYSKNKASAKL